MGLVYCEVEAYPTRDGTSQILFTWNHNDGTGFEFKQLYQISIFFTTTPAYQITLNSNYGVYDDNPFSDSMTYVEKWDITNDAPVEGVYREWWRRGGGYTVVAWISYRTQSGDTSTYQFSRLTTSKLLTELSPSVTYNNGTLTIGPLVPGRRVLEFRRTDTAYGGSTGITDESTLNEALWTTFLNTETSGYVTGPYFAYYNLANNPVLYRWRSGSHSIKVIFNSSTNQARISSAIDSAISQINSVLSSFGVSFYRTETSGEISIIIDAEDILFPNRGNYIYGGTWTTTKSNGFINGATIKLANNFMNYAPIMTYEAVALEELLQSMGAGYDQVEYPFDTTHTDFNYYSKSGTMYTRDVNILRLIYSNVVNAGDKYYEVCRKLNIPKGVYVPESSIANTVRTIQVSNFLTAGGTYEVRAFIVNSSGEVSATSDWITVSIPAILLWSWYGSNGNATAAQTERAYHTLCDPSDVGNWLPVSGNFSYKVWNDLVDKALEVVQAAKPGEGWTNYSGLSAEGCKVSVGDTLSAAQYNEVRFNLGSIISTGIVDKSSGDEVFGYYITKLTDTINQIINTL